MKSVNKITLLSLTVVSLFLIGCKKEEIACDPAKYPELADPITRGKNDGLAFIEKEKATGKAAGEALTREDGLKEGRVILYDKIYAEYLKKGIDETYGSAFNQGSADQVSYKNGQDAGYAKGLAEGKAKAKANGYKTGCHDGKILGQSAIRYPDGDPAYELTCRGAADSLGLYYNSRKSATPTMADQDRCYKNSYNSIVGTDTSKYKREAFEMAKKANTQYQDGYATGQDRNNPENASTVSNASTKGLEDGKAKGQATGLADGKKEAYNRGYNEAYPRGYALGVSDANSVIAGYGVAPTIYVQWYEDYAKNTVYSQYQFKGGSEGLKKGFEKGVAIKCGFTSIPDCE